MTDFICSRAPIALIAVALMLAAAPASSQPSDAQRKQARVLMEEGDVLADQRDYARALEKYQTADAIMHVPTTGFEVARALAALGRLVDAQDAALGVTRLPAGAKEPEVFTQARTDAAALAQSLSARIPSLQVIVTGAKRGVVVELRIDGKLVPAATASRPQKLDPGKHQIVATVAGQGSATKAVELAEGGRGKVVLEISPSAVSSPAAAIGHREREPVRPGRKTSPLVYAGFGVGVVGLIVGSTAGVISLDKASKAKDQCEGNRCPPSASDDIDWSKTLATVSNIGFGVAILGTAVGVYGLLRSQRTGEESALAARARLHPVVAPRFVGVEGSF